MTFFLPVAYAADSIPKKVNVCKSFFNILSLPCAGDAGATDESSSIVGLIGRLVDFILGISASVALAMIVYGGFLIVLAAADPDQAQKGRSLIVNALLGLLVILFAFIITSAVRAFIYGNVG